MWQRCTVYMYCVHNEHHYAFIKENPNYNVQLYEYFVTRSALELFNIKIGLPKEISSFFSYKENSNYLVE